MPASPRPPPPPPAGPRRNLAGSWRARRRDPAAGPSRGAALRAARAGLGVPARGRGPVRSGARGAGRSCRPGAGRRAADIWPASEVCAPPASPSRPEQRRSPSDGIDWLRRRPMGASPPRPGGERGGSGARGTTPLLPHPPPASPQRPPRNPGAARGPGCGRPLVPRGAPAVDGGLKPFAPSRAPA
eukprot:XP_025007075.1 uncharacterized protein LOC112532561 [Gallus gallus]